jgi:hypothetical protein
MIVFEVRRSPGLDRLLRYGPRMAREAAVLTMQRAAEAHVAAIHRNIELGKSFKSRTGALERSIQWRRAGNHVEIFASVPHAPHIEYGTGLWGPKNKKYKIEPKAAPEGKPDLARKALRWFSGGKAVFAVRVMHPGMKPRPFMLRGKLPVVEIMDAARDAHRRIFGPSLLPAISRLDLTVPRAGG